MVKIVWRTQKTMPFPCSLCASSFASKGKRRKNHRNLLAFPKSYNGRQGGRRKSPLWLPDPREALSHICCIILQILQCTLSFYGDVFPRQEKSEPILLKEKIRIWSQLVEHTGLEPVISTLPEVIIYSRYVQFSTDGFKDDISLKLLISARFRYIITQNHAITKPYRYTKYTNNFT